MTRLFFYLFVFTSVFAGKAYGQTCTTLGQNPSTAFPVCGISEFHQVTVPFCGGRSVPAPPCPRAPFSDKNPFWYKFTCYTTGTLGFLINPNTPEDYDWELFDVTGRNPDDVYNDPSLIVAFNWSAEYQPTGTSNTLGTSLRECDGPGVNTYSAMPTIVQGRNYILLVSHFSNTPNGYTLSFGGGTASITDPNKPAMLAASAPCDGTLTTLKLNKAIKCNSLSADGSEFYLVPNVANVVGATGVNCSNAFDMDSVNLTIDAPLPPGNYFIKIKNGGDGNTLVDNCDLTIPVGDSIPLTIYPLIPTAIDSLTQPGCAPASLELVFKKRMFCNSIEPGGSDFFITGPEPISIVSATGVDCDNEGLSRKIIVTFNKPLQVGGLYTIGLVTGSDGNTLLNECKMASVPGQTLSFPIADTVNADFTYTISYGCERDTIHYFYASRNGVNKWSWNFDNLRKSTLQNPVIGYASFGQKFTQLIVTNGVCRDTSPVVHIFLDNTLKAAFSSPEFVCPNEPAAFTDNSIGKQLTWSWDFDNGNSSTLQQPPSQLYPFNTRTDRTVFPQLIITDSYGCSDTAKNVIKVPNSCFIDVPNAFTPNGDGINDYLYPLAAYKAKDLLFRIYNRFGQLVFESRDWNYRWDGRFKGQGADPGTYVWTLHYTNTQTGKVIDRKGTSILIRQ